MSNDFKDVFHMEPEDEKRQFLADLQEAIEDCIESGYDVSFQEVCKNNGVKMCACTIREANAFVAPTLYLDTYFPYYQDGMSIRAIATEIVSGAKNTEIPSFLNPYFLDDYEEVKKHLFVKLIGYESNEDMLMDCIYRKMEDLAGVVYYMTESEEHGSGLIMLRKEMLIDWKMKDTQVYADALYNSVHMLPATFDDMQGFLNAEDANGQAGRLFILTNVKSCLGASAILYPEMLHNISELLHSDLLILPSSIHEVIVMADHGEDREKLQSMVYEINHTQVNPQEILTDSVYFFSRKEETFHKIA